MNICMKKNMHKLTEVKNKGYVTLREKKMNGCHLSKGTGRAKRGRTNLQGAEISLELGDMDVKRGPC